MHNTSTIKENINHHIYIHKSRVILNINKLQCYWVIDLYNKAFWYLIYVERQKETVTV